MAALIRPRAHLAKVGLQNSLIKEYTLNHIRDPSIS